MPIRNPLEWLVGAANATTTSIGAANPEDYWTRNPGAPPTIRRIGRQDIAVALARGLDDFRANRTDVMMLALIYPVVGILLAAWGSGYHLLPLLFPLASGFALIGPFGAVWLYEMSRRREGGRSVTLLDAVQVYRSPQIGRILALGGILVALLLAWLAVAERLYEATLGPAMPATFPAFFTATFTTGAGFAMLFAGLAIGFVFALVAFAISVISFPLLLERNVDLGTAMLASVRALRENPRPLALWAAIVTGGLVLGAIPALVGLAVVLPVLGHSTWHLYRRVVR